MTSFPRGIAAETRQALTHIRTALAACGAAMDGIVKANVYLVGIDHFAEMNAVYASFFAACRATRRPIAGHNPSAVAVRSSCR